MLSAEVKEAAANFVKEVKLTKKKMRENIFAKMAKPVKLDDGLYPATTIVESLNWQKATVDCVSIAVFKAFLWNHVGDVCKFNRKLANFQKFQAVFFTLAQFSSFLLACFGRSFLCLTEQDRSDKSAVFVCPYGTIKKSFMEADFNSFSELYKEQGWSPLKVDTTVSTGKLLCKYGNLNPQLVFVLEEMRANHNGKIGIFYKVVLPDDEAKVIQLMPGVSFRGRRGVIPQDILAQRNARLPVITYKANSQQLNKVTFAFRAMQVVNQKLTWKVKPLWVTREEEKEDDETVLLTIPTAFQRSGAYMDADFLDGGFLANQHVMFKLFSDEWRHLLVTRFLPPNERQGNPYTYEAKIVGTGGRLPIFFQLGRYNAEAEGDAEAGTWFALTPRF